MFRAHLHEKKGDVRKAIKHIEKKSKYILDEVRRSEMLIKLLILDKKSNKALNEVNKLIEINQWNKDYYELALECKGIDYKDPANIS